MKPFIIIGIITYKRPTMLNRAIECLKKLITLDGILIETIVVDNDEYKSAEPVVKKQIGKLRFPLRYFHEKKRGIPFARNRVIVEAIELGATEIAFFDDDEVVEPDWLLLLYNAYKKYDCDIVTGPVLTRYPTNTPQWALKGKFYDRKRFKTGMTRDRAASGNVLFAIKWFKEGGLSFNEDMALSGGSDTHLTQKIARNGGIIKWVDNAVAYEEVPYSRLTIKWLLQRHYRIRLISIKNSLEQNGILHTYFFSMLNFFKNVALCFINGIISVVLGSHYLVKALICFTRFSAVLAALIFNHNYEEYKTIHGK